MAIAHGLKGNGCTFRELREESTDGVRGVTDPGVLDQISLLIQDSEEREVLVSITTDRII